MLSLLGNCSPRIVSLTVIKKYCYTSLYEISIETLTSSNLTAVKELCEDDELGVEEELEGKS